MPKDVDKNWVYCHECERGGNGSDKDKCTCGWEIKKKTSLGCYIGVKIEKNNIPCNAPAGHECPGMTRLCEAECDCEYRQK